MADEPDVNESRWLVVLSCGCVTVDDEEPERDDEWECEVHDETALAVQWVDRSAT